MFGCAQQHGLTSSQRQQAKYAQYGSFHLQSMGGYVALCLAGINHLNKASPLREMMQIKAPL
jgi:hypothetical protein